ncbi:MAG: amidase family protein [Burkholderiaceae bacterium]
MVALHELDGTQLRLLIAKRETSALEVAEAALARLDAVNPWLNAVVDCRPDEVRTRAREIDARLARGEDCGPLAGVPMTVKINVDQTGRATSNGLRLQKDLIAEHDSPVVTNLLANGAVIVGRTNAPAFSYRWFTNNQLHGRTRNPRDPALTPGGSSGGAASSVASGICAIGHGTDIAGSIRYPAYACGVHGLRPSLGRVAAFNASSPERSIGGQITAVSGPIARSIADLRLALAALAQPSVRDPWWVPAPLTGPDMPRTVALCLRPDGLAIADEVEAALLDAADRLRDAGWTVVEVDALPPLKAASAAQIVLWLGDGYDAMVASAEREGDPGAIAVLAGQAHVGKGMTLQRFAGALVERATITRAWQEFLQQYAVALLPVSGELPFPDDLDCQGPEAYARVWQAQMPMIGLPLTGLPALSVATGMTPRGPVGVQLVAARFREDLCLDAAQAIEAGGVPPMPTEPVRG